MGENTEKKFLEVWHDAELTLFAREKCLIVDRSRISDGKRCSMLRFLGYEWNGKGISSSRINEDLAFGTALHLGLEGMIGSLSAPEQAEGVSWPQVAADSFRSNKDQIIIQGNPDLQEMLPEVFDLLIEEQAQLIYSLVWTFERRLLPLILAEYDVVSIEEEIVWFLGRYDGVDVIIATRPDVVLRRKSDQKLVVVSYKSKKKMYDSSIEEQAIDDQVDTELLAVREKYGEIPAGVLYVDFMKGEKEFDDSLMQKRYKTGLIRPLMMENFSDTSDPMAYRWHRSYYKISEKTGEISNGRLMKGWIQVDVWTLMHQSEWLEMLDSQSIGPVGMQGENQDWLGMAIIVPDLVTRTVEQLDEWRMSTLLAEVQRKRLIEDPRFHWRSKVQKTSSSCFAFNSKCRFYEVCHGSGSPERLMMSSRWTERQANHPIEFDESTD